MPQWHIVVVVVVAQEEGEGIPRESYLPPCRHSQPLGPSVDWPGNQRSRSWERNSRNALGQAPALFQDTAVTVGKLAWESLYSCRTLTFITGRCRLLFHQPATRPAGQGMAIQNLSLSYSIPRLPWGRVDAGIQLTLAACPFPQPAATFSRC